MRAALLAFVLFLGGCSLVDLAEKPETFALCAAADAATTIYAVSGGHGIEVNPILSGSVNAHNWLRLIAVKAALVGLIWWAYDRWQEQAKYGVIGASAITCGVAANNGLVILKAIRP